MPGEPAAGSPINQNTKADAKTKANAFRANATKTGRTNQNQQKQTRESTFNKLNKLFEDIIEATDPNAQPAAQSIYDFLKSTWFPQFFRGEGITVNDPNIDKLIQNVQTTWSKDQGQAALNQLASAVISSKPWSDDQGGGRGYGGGSSQPNWPQNLPTYPAEQEKLAVSMLAAMKPEQVDNIVSQVKTTRQPPAKSTA